MVKQPQSRKKWTLFLLISQTLKLILYGVPGTLSKMCSDGIVECTYVQVLSEWFSSSPSASSTKNSICVLFCSLHVIDLEKKHKVFFLLHFLVTKSLPLLPSNTIRGVVIIHEIHPYTPPIAFYDRISTSMPSFDNFVKHRCFHFFTQTEFFHLCGHHILPI